MEFVPVPFWFRILVALVPVTLAASLILLGVAGFGPRRRRRSALKWAGIAFAATVADTILVVLVAILALGKISDGS